MQRFIVRAESRHVTEIATALTGYVPVMDRVTKPSRKKQPVTSSVPIFHGWVFVPFLPHLYELARKTKGVRGVMKYGRRGVLLLEESDFDQIKIIEAQQVLPLFLPLDYEFSIGELVRLPLLLNNVTGKILKIKGTRAHIDIGGNYPVVLDCCLLTPLNLNMAQSGDPETPLGEFRPGA